LSDLTRPGQWWAPSSKHAKRTAVGTAAIVIALALITWTVWASPSSPVSTAVHHALGVKTTQDKVADAKKLQTKLTAAQSQIWKLEGQLKSLSASKNARGDQITQLQSQIQALQSQLGAAQAQAAAAGSAAKSGTTTSVSHSASTVVKGSGSGTSTAAAGPVATPSKSQILSQPTRFYGLYTDQSPFNWASYDAIQQKVGMGTNMVGYFQGFDQSFNASAVNRSWANGRLPMMTWESAPSQSGNDTPYIAGYTNQDIISGKFDAYLTQYAQAVKANGQPLVIRLDHEMNGSWYNWSEGTKQQNAAGSYSAMWQHVWNIFQAQGANDDVIWDWSPTRIDGLGNKAYMEESYLKEYYPGDQYVDWVGMSGYYRDSSTTPTFSNTFDATLKQLRDIAPSKGVILSEIGATETGGSTTNGQKAQWITSLFNALADPKYSYIVGFNYFDETATTITDGVRSTNDWRLDSRADSLAAFAAGIKRTDINFDLQEVPAS
jgi:beta-mannanase